MFIKTLASILIGLFLFQNAMAYAKETADQKFEVLANNYITELLKMNPEWATNLGEHKGKIDLKKMHDEMLSFGSPPAKYVKEMMELN